MRYTVRLEDRQTRARSVIYIEAKNYQEAKAIAMRDYGVSYIVTI